MRNGKKIKKGLLFFLLAVISILMISCGHQANFESGISTDAQIDNKPNAPEIDLTKEWVIVVGDGDNECMSTVRFIKGAFKELFGYEPELTTDLFGFDGKCEILVGKTTRESSASVYDTIENGVYKYEVVNENAIVIAGYNARDTKLAAERFMLDLFGYTTAGTGKANSVYVGTSYTGAYEYESPFNNPLIDDYADPDVLYYDGVYYLYATYDLGMNGYNVLTSTDLVNWENHGNCLDTSSGETNSWGLSRWYWAPDVEEHNGKFYMLASVDEHLGLMIADSPLGPFIPQDGFLLEGTIDGHILFDGDDMYIYYVSWRSGRKYGIYGCKMLDDHITPDFSTEKLLISPTRPYEQNPYNLPTTEGPFMLVKDGVYYLTYSGSYFTSHAYCVCYATSDSPLGDFEKYLYNPILASDNADVYGPGHHTITTMPDSDQMVIVYHIHNSVTNATPRKISADLISFVETPDGFVLKCEGPSIGK